MQLMLCNVRSKRVLDDFRQVFRFTCRTDESIEGARW